MISFKINDEIKSLSGDYDELIIFCPFIVTKESKNVLNIFHQQKEKIIVIGEHQI